MAKLTTEKIKKYREINENGFKINISSLIYQFAHGDEYPKFEKEVYKDNKTVLKIEISFFKFYDKSSEYRIKVIEYRKENGFLICGLGTFEKFILKEENEKHKFNFNYLKGLCNKIDKKNELEILEEYKLFYQKKINKRGVQ